MPQWCYHCGSYLNLSTTTGICTNCLAQLPWWKVEICANCLEPKIYCYSCNKEPAIHPIFSYQNPINFWISSMKYKNNFYACRLLSKLIYNWLQLNHSFLSDYDVVIPIPTHKSNFFLRGFNPSQLLIKNLFKKKLQQNLVYKITKTKPQASLYSYRDRKKLLSKKIFDVSDAVKGKKILIFDDVVTSKSTVFNLTREIRKKGSEDIKILCLARINFKSEIV